MSDPHETGDKMHSLVSATTFGLDIFYTEPYL